MSDSAHWTPNADSFYAHSHPNDRWQLLESHLREVATRAAGFAEPFGAQSWGHLAGLWHDLGKYSAEFQAYLRASGDAAEEAPAYRVDHSTAGAQHADREIPRLGRLISYAIAGHHGGLPDGLCDGSCLAERLRKPVAEWGAAPEALLRPGDSIVLPAAAEAAHRPLQISLFTRMVFSALVDADFLDTERFLNPQQGASRGSITDLEALAARLRQELDALQASAAPTGVNAARLFVREACLAAAEHSPGFFSLNVPTGGGKTLSSLAFALSHAIRHGLRRVIYAIPYTSIIEQNASVFRQYIGADAVLEHHSNLDGDHDTPWGRLSAENWDAPVIATTNVQFFESFFGNRPSACRRLHNVARSVVILDEVQALPVPFLEPCLALLRQLVSSYACTVVLCTATQPALEWREEFPIGLRDVRPIISDPAPLFSKLRRVRVKQRGKLLDSGLVEELGRQPQVLCVVNTRRHARELFKRLGRDAANIHLSALMCPAHRTRKLDEIRRRLKAGEPCRVVSTQLIEAGVDVDFPVVYRAMAGLDSVAQAAGRCNREGLLAEGLAVLFDAEPPIPAGHLRQSAQAAAEVLRQADDVLAPSTVEEYFRLFYWQRKTDWDKARIMSRLKAGYPQLSFPFRSIAEDFQFIRDGMLPVIIAWDKRASGAIEDLRYAPVPPAGTDRLLQRYVVTVPRCVRDSLPIEVLHDRFYVLANPDLYDDDLGLRTETTLQTWEPEQLMV